jgi:hypothetical protein
VGSEEDGRESRWRRSTVSGGDGGSQEDGAVGLRGRGKYPRNAAVGGAWHILQLPLLEPVQWIPPPPFCTSEEGLGKPLESV